MTDPIAAASILVALTPADVQAIESAISVLYAEWHGGDRMPDDCEAVLNKIRPVTP